MSINTHFVATEQYNNHPQETFVVDGDYKTTWSQDSLSSSPHSYSFQKINIETKKKENRARVRINKLHWESIPRANNPAKFLQEKAINLLSVFEFKLRHLEVFVLNHAYLSRITKCKKDQNVNLLKQLTDIFDIAFHAKLVVDDKIYHNCYTIKHTTLGKNIIDHPIDHPIDHLDTNLAKKHSEHKTAANPIYMQSAEALKDDACAEFFPRSYIYKKEEYNKNRSIKSNFVKNNFSNHSAESNSSKKLFRASKSSIATIKHSKEQLRKLIKSLKPQIKTAIKYEKPQKLNDFYPLAEEDIAELQHKSGREFSRRAINEILKDMGRKLTKPEFWSRKGFISYMSKALKYELQDAVKVSNETFRIRSNETTEEQRERIEEEYLTALEYSLQVSPQWHFKKKLAAVLERSRAYEILTSLQWIDLSKEGIMQIKLRKRLGSKITKLEKEIILNQAKATHETYRNGEYVEVMAIEIIEPENEVIVENTEIIEDAGRVDTVDNLWLKQEIFLPAIAPETAWSRARESLIRYYGMEGVGIDKSWFSELKAEINEERKEIKLKAKGNFYKDWIESNYLEVISKMAKEQGYSVSGIVVD